MSAGFQLNEDQQAILDAADLYSRKQLLPLAPKMDDEAVSYTHLTLPTT